MSEVVIKCWFNTPTESIEVVCTELKKRGYSTKCIGRFEYPDPDEFCLEYISKANPLILLVWDRSQSPEFLKKLKEVKKTISTRVYLFNWDDPHSCSEWIERSCREEQHLSVYDKVFSCCRGTKEVYSSFGVREWCYLLPCVGECHYPEKDEEYECDVSVVCTNLYENFPHQLINRKKLIDALYTSGLKFNFYGPEKFREVYPLAYKGYVPYTSNRKIFHNSKLTISTHIESGESYLNERDVTALASGGLVLSDPIEGIEIESEGCILKMKSSNTEEVILQIKDILSHYEDYEPLKEKGREVAEKWKVQPWVDALLRVDYTPGEFVFFSKRGNGGYGDRVVGIASVNFLGEFYGKKVRVVWDEDCSTIFEDYQEYDPEDFKNHTSVKWIDARASEARDFFENTSKEEIIKGNYLIQTNQPVQQYLWDLGLSEGKNFKEMYRRSYQSIYTKILKLKNPPSSSYDLGIQIRCGDAYATGKGTHVYIPRHLFDAYCQSVSDIISREFTPPISIFITCDTNEIYEKLREKLSPFGTVEILQKEENYHFDMSSSSSSQMRKCIIEHYLLTKSKIIMCMFNSNFGITAPLVNSEVSDSIILGFTGSGWIREHHNLVNRPRAKTRMLECVYQN